MSVVADFSVEIEQVNDSTLFLAHVYAAVAASLTSSVASNYCRHSVLLGYLYKVRTTVVELIFRHQV